MFRLSDGGRFTAIECSDFNLFARYLTEGPAAITPVLQERQAIGFNMLRVWLAFWGDAQFEQEIGRLVPSEHPEMYEQLQPFAALCARYGFYLEFTAFCADFVPNHWESIGAGLQGVTNVLLELVNEHGAYHSTLDPRQFSPHAGMLCSHGSSGAGQIPVRPWWDYETFHTNELFEWWRKGSHNGMELCDGDPEGHIAPSHRPILTNENTRPDEDGAMQHHEDNAAACALLVAGCCHHSASGKKSALFSPFDRPYADAFVRGMKSVNLDYQDGRYYREDPGANLRVYSRINPDGSRETVEIRK